MAAKIKPKPLAGNASQLAKLAALAASDYDTDYKSGNATYRMYCEVCGVRHALNSLCGYCIGKVKMIRAESGPSIYAEPTIHPTESEGAE